jgi:hypothetical protein
LIFVILGVIVVVIVATWFITRALPRITGYATRLFVIGLVIALAGILVRGNEESLIVAAGALMTAVGISFLVIGGIVFVRAYLAGEFDRK